MADAAGLLVLESMIFQAEAEVRRLRPLRDPDSSATTPPAAGRPAAPAVAPTEVVR